MLNGRAFPTFSPHTPETYPGTTTCLLVPEARSEDQASPLPRRLATCSGRIGFTRLGRRVWDGRFASGCSPPRLAATQLPSATRRHVSVVLDLSSVSLISITHARGSAVPALLKAPVASTATTTAPRRLQSITRPHRPDGARSGYRGIPPCRWHDFALRTASSSRAVTAAPGCWGQTTQGTQSLPARPK